MNSLKEKNQDLAPLGEAEVIFFLHPITSSSFLYLKLAGQDQSTILERHSPGRIYLKASKIFKKNDSGLPLCTSCSLHPWQQHTQTIITSLSKWHALLHSIYTMPALAQTGALTTAPSTPCSDEISSCRKTAAAKTPMSLKEITGGGEGPNHK